MWQQAKTLHQVNALGKLKSSQCFYFEYFSAEYSVSVYT